MPLRPSEGSAFPLWNDRSVAACEEVLHHRMMPTYVPPEAATRLIRDYGLTMTAANFWSGASVSDHAMKPAPTVAEFEARRREYPAELRLYNWTADEIFNAPELTEPLHRWSRNMHRAGIESMLVAPPTPELFDDGTRTGRTAVDIWPIQYLYYTMSPGNVENAVKKGMEVWTYTALNQEGHAPKWLLDFAPVNYRVLPGFLNQSMGFPGILYWCIDHWQAGADPWRGAPFHSEGGATFPGEGVLVYPGRGAGVPGVVPLMRLNWIRDGLEDYEYVALLKKAGQTNDALKIARGVAADFKSWSQRPADYDEAHRRIGEILSGAHRLPRPYVNRGQGMSHFRGQK